MELHLNLTIDEFDALASRFASFFDQPKGSQIMAAIENLTTEVSEATTVMQSAATLIGGLRAEVQAVRDELASQNVTNDRLDELAERLDTGANALAAAVAENTPADPQNPTNPQEPTDPVNPTDPVDPVQPTDPVVTEPVNPAEDPSFDPNAPIAPGPSNGPV